MPRCLTALVKVALERLPAARASVGFRRKSPYRMPVLRSHHDGLALKGLLALHVAERGAQEINRCHEQRGVSIGQSDRAEKRAAWQAIATVIGHAQSLFRIPLCCLRATVLSGLLDRNLLHLCLE